MNLKIKLFEIKNLFNQFDVSIPLTQDVNIFLGENGMGKTTILSCLYSVLSGNIQNLSDVVFDKLILTLSNDQHFTLQHSDLICYVEEYIYERPTLKRRRARVESIYSEKEIAEMKSIISDSTFEPDAIKKYTYKFADVYGTSLQFATMELERYCFHSNKGNAEKAIKFKKDIKAIIDQDILYFPTYRRIEEDITKLGIDIDYDKVKNRFINFGMTDVEKASEKILSTIRSIAINSFASLTGILLKQYLDGNLDSTPSHGNKIDLGKLKITLARVGDEIEKDDKDKIEQLVSSENIYNPDKVYLLNLLEQLIDSYDKQNAYDDRVKKFVSVCNKYLNNKKFIYDESNLQLGIYRNGTKKPIKIQNLSSGEKQIISLFSKLYLEETDNCIILFDEPELSLSIKWQSQFLPDIMQSERCSTLISVTHSPFIFDNIYDELARDMGECLIEKE